MKKILSLVCAFAIFSSHSSFAATSAIVREEMSRIYLTAQNGGEINEAIVNAGLTMKEKGVTIDDFIEYETSDMNPKEKAAFVKRMDQLKNDLVEADSAEEMSHIITESIVNRSTGSHFLACPNSTAPIWIAAGVSLVAWYVIGNVILAKRADKKDKIADPWVAVEKEINVKVAAGVSESSAEMIALRAQYANYEAEAEAFDKEERKIVQTTLLAALVPMGLIGYGMHCQLSE